MDRHIEDDVARQYVSTTEAARILGVRPKVGGQLVRQGRLPAVKLANRWLVPRSFVEEMAKTYVPKVGRPRQKRRYTKRHPKWFAKEAP